MVTISVLQDSVEIHRLCFSLESSALVWLSVNLGIQGFDSAEIVEEDGKTVHRFTLEE